MRFVETPISGAYLIELERKEDERGFFARAFCSGEFMQHGLATAIAQCNISFNRREGTVRGLHLQRQPDAEAKLFRCIRGATHHVAVDMRPESPTYGSSIGIELTAENRNAVYIPELCAAGYQTLASESEVFYMTSAPYSPACEQGFRYDDPDLDIDWPLEVSAISDKDLSWPLIGVARKPERSPE